MRDKNDGRHTLPTAGLDIVCLGELLIDFLPGESEDVFIRRPGGAPANVAVTAARNGFSAGVCSRVGDDAFGRYLGRVLSESGVCFLTPEPVPWASTTMAFVSLDERGDRSFTFARKPGADMFLERKDVEACGSSGARIVHAGSCSLSAAPADDATLYAIRLAKEKGKLVSFDVNYRDLMWQGDKARAREAIRQVLPYVDLLKYSDDEENLLDADCDALAVQYHIPVIVETLGARGVRASVHGNRLTVPARPVACVDSTGAGDAFWGTFLSCILSAQARSAQELGMDLLQTALVYGNVAGSLCVQHKGAMTGVSTITEIRHFLAEQAAGFT